jgi:hypothetical protein
MNDLVLNVGFITVLSDVRTISQASVVNVGVDRG